MQTDQNKGIQNHLRNYGSQWLVALVLLVSIIVASKRAFLPMLGSSLRFLAPFIIIWAVYRIIRRRVSRGIAKFQEQMMAGMQGGAQPFGRPAAEGNNTVLDLCPKCGTLMQPKHQCRTSV